MQIRKEVKLSLFADNIMYIGNPKESKSQLLELNLGSSQDTVLIYKNQ